MSNINSASALHNSVLPTPLKITLCMRLLCVGWLMISFQIQILVSPVGPKNIRDAIGFDGSFNPARERWIASVITCTASF